jgi:hypothetical protein
LNELFQSFTPGATLKFDVSLTGNPDPGLFPDEFSFAILDNTLGEIPTTGGGDAFLTVDITPQGPVFSTFAGDGAYSAIPSPTITTVSSVVPEPGELSALGAVLFTGAFLLRSITVVAAPNFGYNFVNWTEGADVVSSSTSFTFTAEANRSLVANFALIPVATDVTAQFKIQIGGYRYNRKTGRYVQRITLTNKGGPLNGPISLVLDGLSANATLLNKTAVTILLAPAGSPYINVASGNMAPKAKVSVDLEFSDPSNATINYSTRVLAGTGSR